MNKIEKFLSNPWRLFNHIDFFHWEDWLPDKQYLQLLWRMEYGRKLDLKHPKTFTEKMQWLKLYDRKPEYTIMADKVKAKDWVAERIGKEHIIPTLGVWNNADEVNFDILPNRFVIKCNHNSSGLYICKDKSKMDVDSVRRELNRGLQEDYYLRNREWPYKNIPRQILAEEYLEDKRHTGDLPDYKFFCFNGEPKYCQVIRGRHSVETIDFYDMEWKHQEFVGLNPVARPSNLDEMINICRKLSKDMSFVRVDLYLVGEKTYFGEITFYPLGGMGTFTPEKYNEILGEMINFPGTLRGGTNIDVNNNGEIILTPWHQDLNDYKFFCFGGKVKFFKIDYDRFTDHHANYYSPEGELLPFGEAEIPPQPEKKLDMPSLLSKMIELAEKLSTGLHFLRVDFYEVNRTVYFGELTFYPAGGMGYFTPDEWNIKLGDMIHLPQ